MLSRTLRRSSRGTQAGHSTAPVRTLLVMTDKLLPTDHSFVQGVLERGLPRQGIEVIFVGLCERSLPADAGDGVTYLVRQRRAKGAVSEALELTLAFVRAWPRIRRADAVFTRNDPAALLLGRLFALLRRRVPHYHQLSFLHAEAILRQASWSLRWRLYAWGDLILRRLLLASTDRVLVVSDAMGQTLAEKNPSLAPALQTFPLGIAAGDFAPRFVPHAQRTRNVIYLGTFGKSRRLEVLIDAIGEYRRRYGPLTLHLWGGSHDRRDDEALKEYVVARGLEESIEFHGKTGRAEALEALHECRIGVSPIPLAPQFVISSPTKAVEYLAAGCAVLATRGIPDQDELIERSGGGLLVEHEPVAIADGLHEMLSRPDETERMARAGREYVLRERSYGVMAERLVELLRTDRSQACPSRWSSPA